MGEENSINFQLTVEVRQIAKMIIDILKDTELDEFPRQQVISGA